ncbi:MAG: hypothetical protein ACFFEK_16160 [Candidatus Thorarchaeota archaeon]
MTCYFRHMKGIFAEIGVDVTPENKKDIDKTIHKLLGVEYKNCSATWKEIKKRLADDESGFIQSLDGALGKL